MALALFCVVGKRGGRIGEGFTNWNMYCPGWSWHAAEHSASRGETHALMALALFCVWGERRGRMQEGFTDWNMYCPG
jgi:hypothetical protein